MARDHTLNPGSVMDDAEHPFYAKPRSRRRGIQIRIALAALAINVVLASLSVATGLYPLPILFIAVTLSIIAPFFDNPSLKARGELVYYSPLFVAEKQNKGVIKIHGGTLLDYVYVIDRTLSGKQRVNQILVGYIDGLLNLLAAHRDRDLSAITLRGTSYIVNERTARRVGLHKVTNPPLQVLILLYNYINLMVSLSIARAKLSFPTMGDISTFEGRLSDIAERETYLRQLRTRLAANRQRHG